MSLPGARAWLWQCYLNASVSSHNTPAFSVKHLFLLQFGVNHLQSRIRGAGVSSPAGVYQLTLLGGGGAQPARQD